MLLDTIVYDQARMAGPPFSVPEDEVRAHYAGATIEVLADRELPIEPRWVDAGHTWMRELVYRIALFRGDDAYRYVVGVRPQGSKLQLVEAYFPSEAHEKRYGDAVWASIEKGDR